MVLTEAQKTNALDILGYLDFNVPCWFREHTLDTLVSVVRGLGTPRAGAVTCLEDDLECFFLYQTGITTIEQKIEVLKFIILQENNM